MSLLLVSLALAGHLRQDVPAASRIRIVPQHSGGLIQDIEESRDGSRLITHDKGYAPRLWDAKRHILLRVLDGHPDTVALVNFSADGRRVLTRSAGQVRVWDSARAKCLFVLPVAEGQATAAVISADGGAVAVGTDKGKVTLYRGETAKPLGTHTAPVRSLAFSPDGSRLASGSEDATGRLWDAKTGAAQMTITGHKGAIQWFDFSRKGDMLLATSADKTASLWTVTGKQLQTYPHVIGHRGVSNVQMAAVFVGKDLAEIAACDKDGTIQLFKPGEATPSRSLKGHTASIRELRRSHDGRYVATYANDHTLRMWDVVVGKEMPFDPAEGDPTAGEFSPHRDVFWLGYSRGEVRQFDLKTGKATKETLGAVDPLNRMQVAADGGIYWRGEAKENKGLIPGAQQHVFFDPSGNRKPLVLEKPFAREQLSPDGRYLVASSRVGGSGFLLYDLATGTIRKSLRAILSYAFSPDSTRIAVLQDDLGEIGLIETKTGEVTKAWKWKTEKDSGGLGGPAWHPNGQWLVTTHHIGKKIMLWDVENGTEIRSFDGDSDTYAEAFFFEGGKKLAVRGQETLFVYDVDTGKLIWKREKTTFNVFGQVAKSGDGSRIAFSSYDKDFNLQAYVLDSAMGTELLHVPGGSEAAVSRDGKRAIVAKGKHAVVYDLASKKELFSTAHASNVQSVAFAPDDQRLITADDVEGVHVWTPKGDRLATFVVMKDGTWLAYDEKGRYDASDPSNVTGAYFILEWDKGLEPIAMTQLKGQFYEPNLFAKALGIDQEARREVPNLDSLRLFPDLAVKHEGKLEYAVEAKGRDNGGIGTVRVSINGKEVARKKGTGYFKLDIEPFKSFLLPETRLGDGKRNLLSVTVSNESGELVSPAEVVDLGVPDDLKAPAVKLYALCVGVGDYVGTVGDLQAPPSDAAALASALTEVSARLLPGKTEITTMTTATGAQRPTRQNILAWLKATGAKATSSDIVFIFVAGHGTNKIGDQTGYFMLTSEADPGELTPASAKTSAISGEELRQALAAIPAGKQVVILDTCHSGAASNSLLASDRSVSGEYQRAWEAIKDTTGTWLLAGAAADQVSYESPNVDHGMLTYALLEAVDKASVDGLRRTPSGELFVDVERWLNYAANRVESLKSEVGIKGVQRPEFKRATRGETFDIGVMDEKRKGFLELRPPMPIVIVGAFEMDQEDPLNLEDAITAAMKEAKSVKPWFDVAKHPGVYRMAGEYSVEGETVKVRLFLQTFDARQQRKTLETIELTSPKTKLRELATQIRSQIESRIKALETKE